jgi:hypothetical protein
MSDYMQHEQLLRLETLKMAFQIEESSTQSKIFYIDVGNLPKVKAEEYIAMLMEKFKETKDGGNYWLPRREGGRGTELVSSPGRVSLESVLATAEKLNRYVMVGAATKQ